MKLGFVTIETGFVVMKAGFVAMELDLVGMNSAIALQAPKDRTKQIRVCANQG